eukprot:COSAG03_NODE_2207_length_3012_cov_7.757981_1_plen_304_part_00
MSGQCDEVHRRLPGGGRRNSGGPLSLYCVYTKALAKALASAFEDCRKVTERMYPGGEVERRAEDNKGHWLHLTGGRITGLIHMPPRAQKILSRPVNAMLAKRVRAQLVGDTSMGARERRERAEETCAKQAGEALQAHPWQDSDTLSLASHEMLVSVVWRYCLDAPVGLQPGRECGHKTCGYCGPALPALRDTEQRIQLAHGARREWLEHTVRGCAWSRGVQRLCHDAVLKVLKLMMESAGFEDVVMEDRWWDEGDDEAKDTRRPDIKTQRFCASYSQTCPLPPCIMGVALSDRRLSYRSSCIT